VAIVIRKNQPFVAADPVQDKEPLRPFATATAELQSPKQELDPAILAVVRSLARTAAREDQRKIEQRDPE